jgi:hypothetical protein
MRLAVPLQPQRSCISTRQLTHNKDRRFSQASTSEFRLKPAEGPVIAFSLTTPDRCLSRPATHSLPGKRTAALLCYRVTHDRNVNFLLDTGCLGAYSRVVNSIAKKGRSHCPGLRRSEMRISWASPARSILKTLSPARRLPYFYLPSPGSHPGIPPRWGLLPVRLESPSRRSPEPCRARCSTGFGAAEGRKEGDTAHPVANDAMLGLGGRRSRSKPKPPDMPSGGLGAD